MRIDFSARRPSLILTAERPAGIWMRLWGNDPAGVRRPPLIVTSRAVAASNNVAGDLKAGCPALAIALPWGHREEG